MQILILILSLVFSLETSTSVAAVSKVKSKSKPTIKRKIAQSQDLTFLSAHYNIRTKNSPLQNIKLNFSPFVNFISFELTQRKLTDERGQNKTIIMDCYPTDKNTKWECLSGCEGGDLKISFHEDTRLDMIKIAPFKIKARNCDGTEDGSDADIISKSGLILTYKN